MLFVRSFMFTYARCYVLNSINILIKDSAGDSGSQKINCWVPKY